VARLNGDIVKVLRRPDLRERFTAQGAESAGSTSAELAAIIRRETALFAKVIQSARIVVE